MYQVHRPEKLTILDKHRLELKLKPLFIAQLSIMDSLLHPAYAYKNGEFVQVLRADEGVTIEFISRYAQTISSEIFVHKDDYKEIQEKLKKDIAKITRTLSQGDPLKKGVKQGNLLSFQMENLYKNPFDDELLSGQFQSSKNFSNLLMQNKSMQKSIYHSLSKQSHHYTVLQPLLSSVLLLSFLQSTGMFSEKEIQNYFLTSYFKDIGMSFIPREKFELAHLNEFDKQMFSEHAQNSMKILEGRLPFNKTQLNIIENHHFLNYKIQSLISGKQLPDQDKMLTGIESTLLSSIDILVAMISKRPYRDDISVFKALELLKKVISDEYPQEFKNLVIFLRHFFKN
jgi:HD-GYP domain-containing protein (c-di-GMP phosphodiesterase class II)